MNVKNMRELWFVVFNLVEARYKAACYLCGWWSEGTEREDTAERMLAIHVSTRQHAELAGEGQ